MLPLIGGGMLVKLSVGGTLNGYITERGVLVGFLGGKFLVFDWCV